MGSLSDFAENELLDHVFNGSYTPPSTVYLGLSTADPLDDKSGLAEPSGNGYARQAIAFSAASARAIIQNGAVNYGQATGAWGTITQWGLFDALTNGNMLAHGQLSTSKVVNTGNTPSVATIEVQVSINAGAVSNYLANKLLDFMFRNQAFAQPATYIALCTASVSDSDTGSTITEPAGGSYARKQVNPNGGSSPTWDLASGGALDNTHDIVIGPPTGSWGTIGYMAIVDALTSGNLLFYDDITDDTPDDGDTVKFPAGDLDVSLS